MSRLNNESTSQLLRWEVADDLHPVKDKGLYLRLMPVFNRLPLYVGTASGKEGIYQRTKVYKRGFASGKYTFVRQSYLKAQRTHDQFVELWNANFKDERFLYIPGISNFIGIEAEGQAFFESTQLLICKLPNESRANLKYLENKLQKEIVKYLDELKTGRPFEKQHPKTHSPYGGQRSPSAAHSEGFVRITHSFESMQEVSTEQLMFYFDKHSSKNLKAG